MMMVMTFVTLVAGAMAMPEPQQTAAVTPATPTAAAAPAAEKLICRRTANIGSNIPSRKMCYTKAQWDSLARNSQGMKRSMEQAWTTPNQ